RSLPKCGRPWRGSTSPGPASHEVRAVEDYVCVTVRSHPGEPEAEFAARLSRFWTHMLRNRPDEFERVYAETTQFERPGDRLSRHEARRARPLELLRPFLLCGPGDRGGPGPGVSAARMVYPDRLHRRRVDGRAVQQRDRDALPRPG